MSRTAWSDTKRLIRDASDRSGRGVIVIDCVPNAVPWASAVASIW